MRRNRIFAVFILALAGLVTCTKNNSPYATGTVSAERKKINIIDSITGANWRITAFTGDESGNGSEFSYITFRFYPDGIVKTLDVPDTVQGKWKYMGDQRTNFELMFAAGTLLSKLNGDYQFIAVNDHIFQLSLKRDGKETRFIEFRKLLRI